MWRSGQFVLGEIDCLEKTRSLHWNRSLWVIIMWWNCYACMYIDANLFSLHYCYKIAVHACKYLLIYCSSELPPASQRKVSGPCLKMKTVFPDIGIPIMKIGGLTIIASGYGLSPVWHYLNQWWKDHLTFIMWIFILVIQHLYVEMAPRPSTLLPTAGTTSQITTRMGIPKLKNQWFSAKEI